MVLILSLQLWVMSCKETMFLCKFFHSKELTQSSCTRFTWCRNMSSMTLFTIYACPSVWGWNMIDIANLAPETHSNTYLWIWHPHRLGLDYEVYTHDHEMTLPSVNNKTCHSWHKVGHFGKFIHTYKDGITTMSRRCQGKDEIHVDHPHFMSWSPMAVTNLLVLE